MIQTRKKSMKLFSASIFINKNFYFHSQSFVSTDIKTLWTREELLFEGLLKEQEMFYNFYQICQTLSLLSYNQGLKRMSNKLMINQFALSTLIHFIKMKMAAYDENIKYSFPTSLGKKTIFQYTYKIILWFDLICQWSVSQLELEKRQIVV